MGLRAHETGASAGGHARHKAYGGSGAVPGHKTGGPPRCARGLSPARHETKRLPRRCDVPASAIVVGLVCSQQQQPVRHSAARADPAGTIGRLPKAVNRGEQLEPVAGPIPTGCVDTWLARTQDRPRLSADRLKPGANRSAMRLRSLCRKLAIAARASRLHAGTGGDLERRAHRHGHRTCSTRMAAA
jgi:hypothetical protein